MFRLAKELLSLNETNEKIKVASNYSDEAVRANNVFNLIETLNLDQVDVLINMITKQTYIKDELLNRQALLKKPELQKTLTTLKLPNDSIDDFNHPDQQKMLEFLEIDLEQARSDESGLRSKFSKLKDECNTLLDNTEFNHNHYKELESKIAKMKEISNQFKTLQEKFKTPSMLTAMSEKFKNIKDDFEKYRTLSFTPDLWEKVAAFLNDPGFKVDTAIVRTVNNKFKMGLNEIKKETEGLNALISQFKTALKSTTISLNEILHLDFEKLDQSILEKINGNENRGFQINHWIVGVQEFSKEVKNLKRMKDLGTITTKLLDNPLFLNILKVKGPSPGQLPNIQEEPSDSDKSYDSDNNEEGALPLTSFNLNQSETPLIALINYLQNELGLEFQIEGAETVVSAMSFASIALTTTRSMKMRQSKCEDLVQQIINNFGLGVQIKRSFN